MLRNRIFVLVLEPDYQLHTEMVDKLWQYKKKKWIFFQEIIWSIG